MLGMAGSAASPTALFLGRLERQARAARLLTGWQVNGGHALLGAVALPALYLWASVRQLHGGAALWTALALAALLGALAFAWAGRRCWNALLRANYEPLVAQARANLVERELLLLCFEPELPAAYEHLRYAAQSHGKTRARNWAELRPGSMHDRVQWLVENYRVICTLEKLPLGTPALRRFTAVCSWCLLLPLGLFILCIPAAALRWLPEDGFVTALLGTTGLLLASGAVFVPLLQLAARIESSALLAVLTAELDVDRLEQAAAGPPALN
jgi:hypothetical protein